MFRSRDWIRYLKHSQLPAKFRTASAIAGLFMRTPKMTTHSVQIGELEIAADNGQLLRELLWEVFICQRYDMGELPEDATIVDAGGNIGIAALYFRLRYPNARIICYEPEPRTFKLLKQNIETNNIKNIDLRPYALSDQNEPLHLYVREMAGDIGASTVPGYRETYHQSSEISKIEVQCRRLSEEIEEIGPIDLLKLDIEGGEAAVFRDMAGKFDAVRRLVMEYHGMPKGRNPLGPILAELEQQDFRVIIDGERRTDWPESYELFLRAEQRVKRSIKQNRPSTELVGCS